MAKTNTKVAGIDTAKAKLDIAVHGSTELWQVPNDKDGWRQLAGLLKAQNVKRIGIEATGGYERGVVEALRAYGFTVSVIQPLQIKAFALARLRRAKTDELDARLIAAFTALMDGDRSPPDRRFSPFADRLTFIEQAEEDYKRAKTRLEHQRDPRLRAKLEADARAAKRRVTYEVARLDADLRRHADLAARLDLVLTIEGIGLRTALALIIGMPELGRISREQAASLAGLAPFDDTSAGRVGEAHIAGGRARVRTALYAAALPAAYKWNPALIALRTRLVDQGKAHKSALIACARKLLIFANAVLQRGQPWEKRPLKS
ncbi:Transposase IS116/IS110/IS902 family protein [bacterium YEK0313]|nr:Transposase IS116/IS110/IS902 family protein [bacterium YEK0313]CEJ14696.1 Transposase IS116/IS110/IS902 family protein [bacterium YEK0313]CEJ15220.1 Transposase IS116/IS110/IS902 family protein [bacterium YEK0313]CEJ15393.1 Transposase IS116/IS110/IS902 family protein [bacterium YEK0313]